MADFCLLIGSDQFTPLHSLFLNKGAGVPEIAAATTPPLLECLRVLIDAKADVNAVICDPPLVLAPAMLALHLDRAEALTMLIEAKANANYRSPQGCSVLLAAILGGKSACAKVLINAGAKIKRDSLGNTPFLALAMETKCQAHRRLRRRNGAGAASRAQQRQVPERWPKMRTAQRKPAGLVCGTGHDTNGEAADRGQS